RARTEQLHAHEIEAEGLGLRFDHLCQARDVGHRSPFERQCGQSGWGPAPGGASTRLCHDNVGIDGQIGASAEESKLRVKAATIALAALLLTGCDGGEEPEPAPAASAAGPRPGEAPMPEGGLPPFGER